MFLKDKIYHKYKFLLVFCFILFNSTTPIAAKDGAFYNIISGDIFLQEGNKNFRIVKNNNKECLINNCLVDIFANDQHITTLNTSGVFYLNIETIDNYDNNILLTIKNSNHKKVNKSFILIIILFRENYHACLSEDIYKFILPEIRPKPKNDAIFQGITMYRYLAKIGCIYIKSII